MLFNSYVFIFGYLPLILLGFYLFAYFHLTQAAKAWLLIGSLFFYAYWNIYYLPLLLGSILFNYCMGSIILNYKSKVALFFGMALDLALLFYFKYFDFFLSVVGAQTDPLANTILPLGISFFTFTQIAYLADAYYGLVERKNNLISYGLFVTIFPHLIAGPILHHKEMLKQFNSLRMFVVNWSNMAQGWFLFILGLFKKVVIADSLPVLLNPVFDGSLEPVPLLQAWFGALAYTLQLYFDFSGYSDMAVGLALLFNLHLPINFNSPYKADSMIDFWKRWHITLSQFLREYLYIPLGGNRKGEFAKMRNLLITMFLGGLWHGAGWTFVLWGVCHGFFLIINHTWRSFNVYLSNGLARCLTLLAIIFTWVIFRSPNLDVCFDILKGMCGFNGIVLPDKYSQSLAFLEPYGVSFQHLTESSFRLYDIAWIFFLFGCALFLPNTSQLQKKFTKYPALCGAACAILFLFALFQINDLSEFLYYQF